MLLIHVSKLILTTDWILGTCSKMQHFQLVPWPIYRYLIAFMTSSNTSAMVELPVSAFNTSSVVELSVSAFTEWQMLVAERNGNYVCAGMIMWLCVWFGWDEPNVCILFNSCSLEHFQRTAKYRCGFCSKKAQRNLEICGQRRNGSSHVLVSFFFFFCISFFL